MRKNPDHSATANGKVSPEALPWSGERASFPPFPPLLGRPVLLRHPTLGRGMRTVAGLIVGTYAVDDRFVIVQAFPIGKVPVQFADVQLLDEDPGVTTDPVTWLLP